MKAGQSHWRLVGRVAAVAVSDHSTDGSCYGRCSAETAHLISTVSDQVANDWSGSESTDGNDPEELIRFSGPLSVKHFCCRWSQTPLNHHGCKNPGKP